MRLSLRLSAAAGMVTEGNRLVDVGCDHGYLPVYLVMEKKIPSAIAMDVRKGPLSRAKKHIAEYGLTEYIETRLSDGLAALEEGEGDTLVIAGMGGPLMERILTEGQRVLGSFQELILQPQSDVRHFRRFLLDSGWVIVEEDMVLEDGKFYPMMKAVSAADLIHAGEEFSGEARLRELTDYTGEEEWFGKLLLAGRHPALYEYLLREDRIRREIRDRLLPAQGEGSRKRMREIEEERRLIQAALKRYEGERTDCSAGGPISGGRRGKLG